MISSVTKTISAICDVYHLVYIFEDLDRTSTTSVVILFIFCQDPVIICLVVEPLALFSLFGGSSSLFYQTPLINRGWGHNSIFSICQSSLIIWYKATLGVSSVLVKNNQIHPRKASRNKYFRIDLN